MLSNVKSPFKSQFTSVEEVWYKAKANGINMRPDPFDLNSNGKSRHRWGAVHESLSRLFERKLSVIKGRRNKKTYDLFDNIADLWRTVSKLFMKAGDKKDIVYINKFSEVLVEISHKEREAMRILLNICQEIILNKFNIF